MDEYIRADNDFRQRREEAYRFSEMTRGFEGFILGTSGPFTTPMPMMKGSAMLSMVIKILSLQA